MKTDIQKKNKKELQLFQLFDFGKMTCKKFMINCIKNKNVEIY